MFICPDCGEHVREPEAHICPADPKNNRLQWYKADLVRYAQELRRESRKPRVRRIKEEAAA